jgi:hypothetical protein
MTLMSDPIRELLQRNVCVSRFRAVVEDDLFAGTACGVVNGCFGAIALKKYGVAGGSFG